MFQGIKCVVRGADHVLKNKICQDAADFKIAEHYAVAVVADGHGSEKYIRSEIGSKWAVQAAVETVDAYMKNYQKFVLSIQRDSDFILKKMEEQFLARWSWYIEAYQEQNPLTEEEQKILKREKAENQDFYSYYGSTILVAVMAEDFYYGMLVGDGGFVVVGQDGSIEIPIEDKNSYANNTSSICSKNAILAMQSFYCEGKALSISVSTDGLIKSFDSEEDFKEYHLLLNTMFSNIENCKVSLERNLNKRTNIGSGDDISISAVFDQESICNKKQYLDECIEKKRMLRKQQKDEAELLKQQKEIEVEIQKNIENIQNIKDIEKTKNLDDSWNVKIVPNFKRKIDDVGKNINYEKINNERRKI